MISLDRFQQLKRESEKLQRESDRAEGALAQLKAELKDKYGCDSVKQADSLVKKKRAEAEVLEEEFDKLLAAFEGEYRERLG